MKPVVYFLWMVFLLLSTTLCLYAQDTPAQFDYSRADSCAHALKGHSINDLEVLSAKLTQSLDTDVEKFRAIFTWVCKNIENDRELYLLNKRNREKLHGNPEALQAWNHEISAKALKTLKERRRTVCTGYAYLVRRLALHAGIPCEIIHGYGRTVESNIGGAGIPNHSWNVVRLNDQWHVCDPTWASGAYDREKRETVNKFEPSYFLAAPELFVRNHYPLDTTWMLLFAKPTLREFLDGPIIYVNAFRLDIHPQSPATLEVHVSKGENFSFSFSAPEYLELGEELSMIIGHTKLRTRAKANEANAGRREYVMTQRFQRKGTYSVHVVGAGGPVVTWRVVVAGK